MPVVVSIPSTLGRTVTYKDPSGVTLPAMIVNAISANLADLRVFADTGAVVGGAVTSGSSSLVRSVSRGTIDGTWQDAAAPTVAVVTTPAVPLTTVPVVNDTGVPVTVYIVGGTITAIAVGGIATGIAVEAGANLAHAIYLSVGQSIAITFSGAPTWTWIA